MNEQLRYGFWTVDAAGLPCFDLTLEDSQALNAPFRHLISTGHVSAMTDRWGNVNLFTTDGGFVWLNSPDSSLSRSSLYFMLQVGGELHSLLFSELHTREKIRIGTGWVGYFGEFRFKGIRLGVLQQFYAPPDRGRVIYGNCILTNLSNEPADLRFSIRSEVAPTRESGPHYKPVQPRHYVAMPGRIISSQVDEQLGDVFLLADAEWEASAHRNSLRLERGIILQAGESMEAACATGFGSKLPHSFTSFEEAQFHWRTKLQPFAVDAPEPWMQQECLWNAGQLLSFTNYDSSVGEYYVALGGYCWSGFAVREPSETSMPLATCSWDLAVSSLRFVAKTQLACGDIPKCHNMRRDRISVDFESDTELWFVLGCCESAATAGKPQFLDEICTFWDGGEGSIWEHLKRAFYWVRDKIGRGSHGLILIRDGDWNDYLSLIGAEGRGESLMNSAMACRAFEAMAVLARARGEKGLATELEAFVFELRRAVDAAFDEEWFLGGYTDHGKPVGSHAEDRLFLNAQSWAALGKCGDSKKRRAALKSAVKKCHTDIGLMLMSRPYSSPAPDDISECAIPAGEGENAGIWPQTIYWMVWALAEEGLLDEALAEWKCGTLRNHARHFPEVPFGIFNGPDCFSSVWAGSREGWTQVQLLDRARSVPMNPMVAWQGFALRKINEATHKMKRTSRNREAGGHPSRLPL